jgi:predicted aminopeptidase
MPEALPGRHRSSGMRTAWLWLCLLLAPWLAGCAQLEYYGQAAKGHLSILQAAKPVDLWLQDPDTKPALKRKLQTAMQIRQFAVDELDLPDNHSYRSYAQLDRPYAVWNIVVTPPLSLTPVRWCFLVVGCVSYRGYYNEASAQAFAQEMRAEGYDVKLGGVPAYSTLGWFSDPLLSTFIGGPDASLAKLVFHELAHQVLYVKDDSAFNESFATAVEQAGVQRWLARYGDDKMRADFAVSEARQRDFLALLLRYRKKLAALYAQESSDAEKLAQKQAILDELRMAYSEQKQRWGGYRGYDLWFAGPLGNSHFVALATYYDLVPGFLQLLQQSGDFPHFYARVKDLATLDKAERNRRLLELAQQYRPG